MVQRINFHTADRWTLTYRNMAVLLGGWVALCLAVQAGLWAYGAVIASRHQALKEGIRVLQVRQERQFQLMAVSKTQEEANTAITSLSHLFADAPHWSGVLKGLAQARLGQLDLSRVAAEIDPRSGAHMAKVEGYADTMEAVTGFVSAMGDVPSFAGTRLTGTTRDVESGKLRFSMTTRLKGTHE
jgi:hypothetical protein